MLFKNLAADVIANKRDYAGHEAIFWEIGSRASALNFAFIHKTNRGPGAGGVRCLKYNTINDVFNDGLRLSQGMSRKNALAGLWWGGGKGIMALSHKSSMYEGSVDDAIVESSEGFEKRRSAFLDYGNFVSSLNGCYYAAEDVGVNTSDMNMIFRRSRYTTCIAREFGGSGNPSTLTARGVICAMEAALAFKKMGGLQGKVVAVQGLGNVATPLIVALLAKRVSKVIATDVNQRRVDDAKVVFRGAPVEIRHVTPEDNSILAESAHIVSPCALGGILNATTIPTIQAPIVVGGANNQLLDTQSDDRLITSRGVIFVPDFVANWMGIVNCANENYGYLTNDPMIERYFDSEWEGSIFKTTTRVLQKARTEGTPTLATASAIADEKIKELHPMWPNRSSHIIKALENDNWSLKALPHKRK